MAEKILTDADLGPRFEALCALWRNTGLEVEITLQGGSMAPTYLPNSRLRLRCAQQDVAVGDVVAYRQGGTLVVHRVIAVEAMQAGGGRQVRCLGDGNIFPDTPVPMAAVLGIVVGAETAALRRRVAYALRHPRRHCRYLLRRLRGRNRPSDVV